MNKLVKDNEVLMAEVAELDSRLRRALDEKAALQKQVGIRPHDHGGPRPCVRAGADPHARTVRTPIQVETLLEEAQSSATSSEISTQLLASVKEHAAQGRAARDEQEKQHGVEREFLLSIFRELEAQITLARTEREELLSRVDRERRSASKRHKARVYCTST